MGATALLFPGQGSHTEGMEEPYRDSPTLLRGLELLGYDPFERMDEGTRYHQPAVFLCSVAAWEESDEEDAVAAAGHSLGEYAALVAAGALDFDDAVPLVDERAAAMAEAAALQPGGMTAVLGGDPVAIAEMAAQFGLVVANDNAPGQIVVSGDLASLEEAEQHARDVLGVRARRLEVTGAFHSPVVVPAVARLEAALARISFREPRIPVYSNGSASPFKDPRSELAANMLAPVRWREILLGLRAAGIERFVELGPGKVLTGLVKRTLLVA